MVHTKFLWSNSIADGSSSAVTENAIFNFAKLMSSANRKHYANVDRAGNAQLYTIAMRVTGDVHQMGLAAPNTYVTKRAVKDWHDARVAMYKRAGIKMSELGYGRELRPYLTYDHFTATINEMDTENSGGNSIAPNYTGDEWTYSRAVVSTPLEESGATHDIHRSDLTDSYSFTLLGDSVIEQDVTASDTSTGITDQNSYVTVGMLKEWLRSFPKRPDTDSDESIDSDNALLQLASGAGPEKEQLLELVDENQEEGRPWDLGGSTHYSHSYAGSIKAGAGDSQTIVMQVPCGLLQVTAFSEAAAQTVYTEFEVLGITDME